MSESSFTMITLVPPSGVAPSVIHLGTQAYNPNADGSFTVDSRLAGPLIHAGWSYRLTGNPPVKAPS
jgi:hypothetical protein